MDSKITKEIKKAKPVQWHEVHSGVSVMSLPPETDILLKSNRQPWSDEQLQCLPDGIRETKASNIIIEFKYSESVNLRSFRQIVSYDHHYKNTHKLSEDAVAGFILSAKETNKSTLHKFGYGPTDKTGIYQSKNPMLENITVILLNELSDQPYNAYFKFFANKKNAKKTAFKVLLQQPLSSDLFHIIRDLWCQWFKKGDDRMDNYELTPEETAEMDQLWLAKMPVKMRLAGLNTEEVMASFDPQQRLAGLDPQQRLAGLDPKEVLINMDLKKVKKILHELNVQC